MKLKKNDLIELKKSGTKAIDKRLAELRLALEEANLKLKRRELSNLHSASIIRRSIAQLKTIRNTNS